MEEPGLTDLQNHIASIGDYRSSLQFARTFLPTLFTEERLDWLGTWDFGQGHVPAEDFVFFSDLSLEMSRTQEAMKPCGHPHWLNEGYRLQLSQCLPAAAPIFDAVINFAQTVARDADGRRSSKGGWVYAHLDAADSWRTSADAILAAYRDVVEGSPQSH